MDEQLTLQDAIEQVQRDPFAIGCLCLTAKVNHLNAIEIVLTAAAQVATLSCPEEHRGGACPFEVCAVEKRTVHRKCNCWLKVGENTGEAIAAEAERDELRAQLDARNRDGDDPWADDGYDPTYPITEQDGDRA